MAARIDAPPGPHQRGGTIQMILDNLFPAVVSSALLVGFVVYRRRIHWKAGLGLVFMSAGFTVFIIAMAMPA